MKCNLLQQNKCGVNQHLIWRTNRWSVTQPCSILWWKSLAAAPAAASWRSSWLENINILMPKLACKRKINGKNLPLKVCNQVRVKFANVTWKCWNIFVWLLRLCLKKKKEFHFESISCMFIFVSGRLISPYRLWVLHLSSADSWISFHKTHTQKKSPSVRAAQSETLKCSNSRNSHQPNAAPRCLKSCSLQGWGLESWSGGSLICGARRPVAATAFVATPPPPAGERSPVLFLTIDCFAAAIFNRLTRLPRLRGLWRAMSTEIEHVHTRRRTEGAFSSSPSPGWEGKGVVKQISSLDFKVGKSTHPSLKMKELALSTGAKDKN